jgi:hypothetical protein
MIPAGVAALLLASGNRLMTILVLMGASLVAIAAQPLLSSTKSDAQDALDSNQETYDRLSFKESDNDSLANSLIVRQGLPLRVLFGCAYLLAFPIPVWQGFQLESAYHLLKSLHALFMYVVIPLAVLAIWRIVGTARLRKAPILFHAFSFAGFLGGVACSSLETRHSNAFLVSLLVVCLIPDMSDAADRHAYRTLLTLFLGLMVMVHCVWLLMKLAV